MASGKRELLGALIVAGPLALAAALVLHESQPDAAARVARSEGPRASGLAAPAAAPTPAAVAAAPVAAAPVAAAPLAAAAPGRPVSPVRATIPPPPAPPTPRSAPVAAPDERALRAELERCADERQRQRLVEQLRRLRFTASPLALAARDPIDLGALADARAASCLPEQAQLLLDPTRPYPVREAAGQALAGVATADASALLEDVAWRGDDTARALAAAALRGRPEGESALARLRSDPAPAVRAAAESALTASIFGRTGALPP